MCQVHLKVLQDMWQQAISFIDAPQTPSVFENVYVLYFTFPLINYLFIWDLGNE
jgi:hypothetical protein